MIKGITDQVTSSKLLWSAWLSAASLAAREVARYL
jgi:hypothetical protein